MSVYLPYQKPPRWNCDPETIAYNCARMGLPVPAIALPMWEGCGRKIYDGSGNKKDGTFNGDPQWCASPFGTAIDFDGASDSISLPAAPDTTSRTREALIFPTDVSAANRGIISNLGWAVGDIHFKIQYGSIKGSIRTSASTNVASDTILPDNWYHVILTYNGINGDFKIYVNGELHNSASAETGITVLHEDIIGDEYSLNSREFIGKMALVRIYHQPVTAFQVRTLYNDLYGMFEPTRKAAWRIPAIGGISIPVIMHHYRQQRL